MKKDDYNNPKVSFAELVDFVEKPCLFPYANYKIIGDTSEIDRIINTFGFINIAIVDIENMLSKDTVNYVTVGSANGESCIANALKIAIGKLPIGIENVSKLLFNIWMPKDREMPMTEIQSMLELINPISSDIDICWGCAHDESLEGQQVKVTLIAAGK